MFLSTILAAILLFLLMIPIPPKLTEATMVTNYANPEAQSTQENASLSTGLLDANVNTSIYKNATQTLNQENSSNATHMKTGQNNTVSSEFHDSNQTIFLTNITGAANIFSFSNAPAEGSSKVTGDFNGDGFEDKAVGVQGEDIGGVSDLGAVNVIYGSASGLSATAVLLDQLWTQNSTGIEGNAEPGDVFGFSLSSGDYNGDGKDDLAVGVPAEGIGPMRAVGGVNVIYGSASGLSATAVLPAQFWTQDSTGVEDVAEPVDFFGLSLSSGDYNGDGKDDLAVGVALEDVDLEVATLENFDDSINSSFIAGDTGVVQVIYGSKSGGLSATAVLPAQVLRQGFANIEDLSEGRDFFGSSL